jgi:hypothetical protein
MRKQRREEMNVVQSDRCASGAKSVDAAPMWAADWLSLAAAPVLAIMALLTATQHGSAADILCSAGHGSSPLSGMTLMYALMSLFHAAPWIRLVSRR